MATKDVKQSWWPFVRAVVLGTAAGAGAGIIGAVWTSLALNEYADRLRIAQRIPQASQIQPTPIPGTYEEALSRVRSRAQVSVAAFLPTSKDGSVPSAWIASQDVTAYGVVVSDDGWIATSMGAFPDVDDIQTLSSTHEIWIAQVRYEITDVLTDSATGLVMARIDAKNLVSIDFAATEHVQSGTMMFIVGDMFVAPTTVVASDAYMDSGVLPAETFTTAWGVAHDSLKGMPVLNAAGDLAGFAQADSSTVLPLHHALAAIRDVVKDGAISLPALGVYTADLTQNIAIASSVRQDLRAGALVVAPNSATRAVVLEGPAADGGLALGDIILAVDGELLTNTTSLPEVLVTYDVGDTMRLSVYRGGETITLSVVLKERSAVVY